MGGNNNNEELASKQLKVDNWGSFFLHRLQLLYEKDDHCDVTLAFHDGEKIKAHKLVLLTCTDYFNNFSMPPNSTVNLPPVLKHSSVLPIINFMYTGRLDFKCENHTNLFMAAKLLNMTILMKLLNAQIKHDSSPKESPQVSSSTVPLTTPAVSTTTPVRKTSTPTKMIAPTKNIVKKIIKSIAPAPAAAITSQTLPGKKLPFWKKRSVPGHLPDEFYQSEAMQPPKPTESPRPTRFEWPEENEVKPPVMYSPSFDSISYDSELMVKAVDLKRAHPDGARNGMDAMVNDDRAALDDVQSCSSAGNGSLSSTSVLLNNNESNKRMRTNDMECFAMDSDDDDDDDGHFESVSNNYDDDDMDDPEPVDGLPGCADVSGSSKPSSPIARTGVNPGVPTTPKPILKPLSTDAVSTPSGTSKKVRFSLSNSSAEGKENTKVAPVGGAKETTITVQNVVAGMPAPEGAAKLSITTPDGKSSNTANHAKIIAEVLKKYPELVKNNKNIRLKIMSPNNKVGFGGAPKTVIAEKDAKGGKSKVSYVVMKSDVAQQSTAAQLKANAAEQPVSGAENTKGPWFCHTCGVGDAPLNFETYYQYRRHLHDVHMERIDARICEYCGYKSSKRNLHLYHLYTKHNVAPPRNISFPKCDQCDYIALSDSLLIKHRTNHVGSSKEYMCKVCNAGFRTNGQLVSHVQSTMHVESPQKEYRCTFCNKVYNRSINLKAHLRSAHKDETSKAYDEEEQQLQQPNHLLQVIQVPVLDALQAGGLKGQHALLLPAGMTILAESPNVSNMLPSSESEALNNVASGIATSLNLAETNLMSDQTVIFLDGNSELLFEPGGSVVLSEDGTTCEVQEYIVPEIMGADMDQLYAAQQHAVIATAGGELQTVTVTTSAAFTAGTPTVLVTSHGGNIVEDPAEAQPSTDHTYAEETAQSEDVEMTEQNMEETQPQVEESSDTAMQVIEEPSVEVGNANEMEAEDFSAVGTPVETIQFAPSAEADAGTAVQMMQVCERDSIIIQPSSVIQPNTMMACQAVAAASPTPSGAVDDDAPVEDCSPAALVAATDGNSTVIVTSVPAAVAEESRGGEEEEEEEEEDEEEEAREVRDAGEEEEEEEQVGTAVVKLQPKEDLTRDWDDFDDDSVPPDTAEDMALDACPSRPTIEMVESILPDM